MCQCLYIAGGGDADLIQASHGTVVSTGERDAGVLAALERQALVPRRHGRGLTQASKGGISNVGRL